MIYGYGLWYDIESQLYTDYPNQYNFISSYKQLKALVNRKEVTQRDVIFFLRSSKSDLDFQEKLSQSGYSLFPNPLVSKAIKHKDRYLPELDGWTRYPLKRRYADNIKSVTRAFIDEAFGDNPVVLKVCNLHASEGKWLLDKNREIPRVPYRMRKLPVTVEEFVPDARSIRVGIVGHTDSFDQIFITEHVNTSTWLKNDEPEEENTYRYNERRRLGIPHLEEMVEESIKIAKSYKTDLLGVDWVVGETKTGLVEVNDMISIPSGRGVHNLVYQAVKAHIDKTILKHQGE
ncbi:hypothetical protein ACPJHQ_05365 [Rossellomorea sp. H39__3]